MYDRLDAQSEITCEVVVSLKKTFFFLPQDWHSIGKVLRFYVVKSTDKQEGKRGLNRDLIVSLKYCILRITIMHRTGGWSRCNRGNI